MNESPAAALLIADQTLSRSDLVVLRAGEPQGLSFVRCDFDRQDLSRLNLHGV